MADKKTLIVANWKMNPVSIKEAAAIFSGIKKASAKTRNIQTVVCPPALFINELQKSLKGGSRGIRQDSIALGAQDISSQQSGAFTGEISAAQFGNADVKYSIVGHSERRAAGDTNKDVAKKVQAALREKLSPIVCVGEYERDEHAEYLAFVRKEIKESLSGVSQKDIKSIIIAYEPIWAIGARARSADTPEGTIEMALFIRKVLTELFPKKSSFAVPILYGGSVNDKNAAAFLANAGVQGLLVGRASIDPKRFASILDIADKLQ